MKNNTLNDEYQGEIIEVIHGVTSRGTPYIVQINDKHIKGKTREQCLEEVNRTAKCYGFKLSYADEKKG